MEPRDFNAILRAEGFAEAIPLSLAAGKGVPEHTHEFAAKVLITAGRFILTRNGIAITHRPGDMFSVPAGHRHAEQAGPAGTEYLVGRRQPTG